MAIVKFYTKVSLEISFNNEMFSNCITQFIKSNIGYKKGKLVTTLQNIEIVIAQDNTDFIKELYTILIKLQQFKVPRIISLIKRKR